MALVWGIGVGWGILAPKGMKEGELALALACCVVAWVKERRLLLHSPFATCSRQESWPWSKESGETSPCPSFAVAFRRVVLVPLLGSTVELNLVVWAQMRQPRGHECGRAGSVTCLWMVAWTKRAALSSSVPCLLWQVRELSLFLTGLGTWESRPCTLPRQHSGADPEGTGMSGLAQGMRGGEMDGTAPCWLWHWVI